MDCDIILLLLGGNVCLVSEFDEVICQVVGSGVVTPRKCPLLVNSHAEACIGWKDTTCGISAMCLRRIT